MPRVARASRKLNPVLRFVSAVLAAAFLSNDAALAAPAIGSLFSSDLVSNPFRLRLPETVATVQDRVRGRSRLIIHVEDAHTNLGAQENTARALDDIVGRYGVRHIFAEGGWGDVSLSFLRPLAPRAARRRIAKQFLMRGELNGVEFFDAASDEAVRVWGVESPELYRQSLRLYAALVKARPAAIAYLDELEKRVDRLKRKLYPRDLVRLDDLVVRYENKEEDFTAYHAALSDAAAAAGIDSSEHPSFQSLSVLRAMEEKIDFAAANAEQTALVARLYEDPAERERVKRDFAHELARVRSTARPSAAFYESLTASARAKGIDTSAYANLDRYAEYLRAFTRVDASTLEEDCATIEEAVYRKVLSTSPDALYLRDVSRYLRLQRALFLVRASKPVYRAYAGFRRDTRFETIVLLAFLNRKLYDAGNYEDVLRFSDVLDRHRGDAEGFYRATEKRDEIFVRNAFDRMDREGVSSAVLVTGGFHTANVKELLRRRGVSYVVVTPHATSETNLDRYEEILLSQLDEAPARPEAVRSGGASRLHQGWAVTRARSGALRRLAFELAGAGGTQAELSRLETINAAIRRQILLPSSRVLRGARLSVTNAHVNAFIEQAREIVGAADFEVIDAADDDRLEAEAVAAGEVVRLPDGNLYARSHSEDVARSEERTFVATRDEDDKGLYDNWRHSDALKPEILSRMTNGMSGKKMYVIPYVMGPAESPLSQVGVMVTDNRYVALNMIRMTTVGQAALDTLKDSDYFVKGIHVTGDLDKLRRAKPGQPEDDRFFASFPDERLILSYGSAYGGNALLAKKFHSLRQASYDARNQGWLAEHMLIVGIEDLETGETKFVTAAFPSASGKTNLAMMLPPDALGSRYRVHLVGDDIAWLRKGPDGRLYAINPESGFFGVAPGTNEKTNPNAMKAIGPGTKTIFTNVAYNAKTGEVWWEGKTPNPPADLEGWFDWKGNPVTAETKQWAHPNSRFTTSIRNAPNLLPDWQDPAKYPHGVPVSAVLFGGRVMKGEFLIRELRSAVDGVYDGATMGVEMTAAAAGNVGEMRADPMAMRPFFSYNEGKYLAHWLSVMDDLGGKAPAFFHVNWFRKDAQGKFLWPGFGENLRPLLWALKRAEGKRADAPAVETPVGFVPTKDALDLTGLSIEEDRLAEVLSYDEAFWKKEISRRGEYLASLGPHVPERIKQAHRETELRLVGARLAAAAEKELDRLAGLKDAHMVLGRLQTLVDEAISIDREIGRTEQARQTASVREKSLYIESVKLLEIKLERIVQNLLTLQKQYALSEPLVDAVTTQTEDMKPLIDARLAAVKERLRRYGARLAAISPSRAQIAWLDKETLEVALDMTRESPLGAARQREAAALKKMEAVFRVYGYDRVRAFLRSGYGPGLLVERLRELDQKARRHAELENYRLRFAIEFDKLDRQSLEVALGMATGVNGAPGPAELEALKQLEAAIEVTGWEQVKAVVRRAEVENALRYKLFGARPPAPLHESALRPYDPAEHEKIHEPLEIGKIEDRAVFAAKPGSDIEVNTMIIKPAGAEELFIPEDLRQFDEVTRKSFERFKSQVPDWRRYIAKITVRRNWVPKDTTQQAAGTARKVGRLHTDGTQRGVAPEKRYPGDVNYIASNAVPTFVYRQGFRVTDEDLLQGDVFASMAEQAKEENGYVVEAFKIYELDPYVPHRADFAAEDTYRTFYRLRFTLKEGEVDANPLLKKGARLATAVNADDYRPGSQAKVLDFSIDGVKYRVTAGIFTGRVDVSRREMKKPFLSFLGKPKEIVSYVPVADIEADLESGFGNVRFKDTASGVIITVTIPESDRAEDVKIAYGDRLSAASPRAVSSDMKPHDALEFPAPPDSGKKSGSRNSADFPESRLVPSRTPEHQALSAAAFSPNRVFVPPSRENIASENRNGWAAGGLFRTAAEALLSRSGASNEAARRGPAGEKGKKGARVSVVVADKLDMAKLAVPGAVSVFSPQDSRERTVERIVESDPEILVVRSSEVTEGLADNLPNLKVVVRAGHGTDNVKLSDEYLRRRGIKVLKTGGSQESVAALALRMIARAAQGDRTAEIDEAPAYFLPLVEWHEAVERKLDRINASSELRDSISRAAADVLRPVDRAAIESLRGQTIGIIGFGIIGQRIAAYAKQLGMNVLVYSPSLAADPSPAQAQGYAVATLEQIYSSSHYVVPITGLYKDGPRRNAGFIDDRAAELLLQNGRFKALVNADRAGLVSKSAAERIVRAGKLYLVERDPSHAGAVEGSLETPHIGASTRTAENDVVAATAEIVQLETAALEEAKNGARLASRKARAEITDVRLGGPLTVEVQKNVDTESAETQIGFVRLYRAGEAAPVSTARVIMPLNLEPQTVAGEVARRNLSLTDASHLAQQAEFALRFLERRGAKLTAASVRPRLTAIQRLFQRALASSGRESGAVIRSLGAILEAVDEAVESLEKQVDEDLPAAADLPAALQSLDRVPQPLRDLALAIADDNPLYKDVTSAKRRFNLLYTQLNKHATPESGARLAVAARLREGRGENPLKDRSREARLFRRDDGRRLPGPSSRPLAATGAALSAPAAREIGRTLAAEIRYLLEPGVPVSIPVQPGAAPGLPALRYTFTKDAVSGAVLFDVAVVRDAESARGEVFLPAELFTRESLDERRFELSRTGARRDAEAALPADYAERLERVSRADVLTEAGTVSRTLPALGTFSFWNPAYSGIWNTWRRSWNGNVKASAGETFVLSVPVEAAFTAQGDLYSVDLNAVTAILAEALRQADGFDGNFLITFTRRGEALSAEARSRITSTLVAIQRSAGMGRVKFGLVHAAGEGLLVDEVRSGLERSEPELRISGLSVGFDFEKGLRGVADPSALKNSESVFAVKLPSASDPEEMLSAAGFVIAGTMRLEAHQSLFARFQEYAGDIESVVLDGVRLLLVKPRRVTGELRELLIAVRSALISA